jgi:hypothetical protein
MKNILVKFECQIGDYQHIDYMLFNKKKSEWGYCKEFWGISKKDELKENCFWDDWMQNAIKVYSETEITNEQTKTLKELVDSNKMFHQFFYISVTDPENDYDEIIYSDDKISDLEKCSKFADRYDNGDKVEPFEFEIR